jgi:hypothetical protein
VSSKSLKIKEGLRAEAKEAALQIACYSDVLLANFYRKVYYTHLR